MIRHALKISGYSESTRKEDRGLHLEKRRCARVPIGVLISWASVDSESRPLDQNKGIIKNVSQTGVRIEAENDVKSKRLKLTLIASDQNIAEITGKVVFSRKILSGIYKIGVQFQGNKSDIIKFVSRLVRFHHYTKNRKCHD
jgi:hypothetical protein